MKALIIGGGIAGTVSAIALRKAGIESVVFESFDRSADGVGAFLTLAVNGIEALQAIDIDTARLGGFATPRMALHLGNGKQLVEFTNGPPLANGATAQTIQRGALYGALRDEAIRRGIRIDYGKRLVSARCTSAGKVIAVFADGSEEEGDLLIGADGLHSRVREIINPNVPGARYVGLLNTGGYARGITVPGQVGTMQMYFGKRCFFCYLPAPNGEVWWFANPARAKELSKAELQAITPAQWRAELCDLFAKDASPAVDLIRATDEILAGWNTYDMPTVPIWHKERMIIIGDAAHATSPSSGQGASMAIEDAVVLAKCLRDEADIDVAFAAYELLRRERVERIVAQGKKNGDSKTPGLLGRAIRDLALRLIFSRQRSNRKDPMQWIFDHHVAWDGATKDGAILNGATAR
ncbi:FAD-dependent monooxygenase [Andreprevotia chitinilytica]|uniref:FAD-dependent monooxygenase n=1 Tax=Andreprevotia chitinilytica TaxID=396808 RepID=UPI00069202FA|nr:FAD-dependent monooxygenase [Andreprevotia chitinilytica]